MTHRDAEWTVNVADAQVPVLVRTPARLADRPALLIQLTNTLAGLDQPHHDIVPRVFLAAGHRVATFDLPNHGRRVDVFGEGLLGMAAAMAAGRDVFADGVATGRALVDAYQTRVGGHPGRLVVAGVSRGGLFALHLLAAEPRIAAAATFAPVTDLAALREFATVADCPRVRQASALELVPRLADRPTYCVISRHDPRVNTEDCIALYRALHAAAPEPSLHVLRLEPGDTHAIPDEAYDAGATWLLGRLA
jgi:dienelactone hydrolase